MLASLLLLVTSGLAQSPLRIAAASDLSVALKAVAAKYEAQSGKKVELTFGSSGSFFAQIQNGAPYDLFFSADVNYPKKLEEAGLVEPGSRYEYAIGNLVIWAPTWAALDVEKLQWRTLKAPTVRRVAIANPQHAPYGRAAIEALQRAGVYQAVKDKLVFGENVSQAAQFVQSGNAEVGIIALSLALAPEMNDGKYWVIPGTMHTVLRQAAVVLQSSREKKVAAEFMAFVGSTRGRAILRKYGFSDAEAW